MSYRASQKAVFAHFTSKQMLSAYFASCSAIMRQQHAAPEERRRWKRNVEIRKNFIIGSLHAMYSTGRFMLFTSSNRNGFIAQYIYICIFNDCVHSSIQPAVVTCCHHTTFVSNMCFYCVCEHIFSTFRALFLRGYAFFAGVNCFAFLFCAYAVASVPASRLRTILLL